MKNIKSILALLLLGGLIVTGCGKKDKNNSKPDSGDSQQPSGDQGGGEVTPSAKYTIVWQNEDGTVLETDENVEAGTVPTYDGASPTKASTVEQVFDFKGWSPEVVAASADATYTATFTASARKYQISWVDGDGNLIKTDEVEYGTLPSYSGADPTKASTEQYDYTWNLWDKGIHEVTGDETYTAQFTPVTRKYTVTWLNYDGTELEVDENVLYGTVPTYDGATPTKPQDAQYSYSWDLDNKWDKEVVAVTGDVTYTAQFIHTTRTYTVTWKNYDESILEVDENVPYGTTPTYDGATPTKPQEAEVRYVHSGWDDEVGPINGDTTYIAQFDTAKAKYTVKFVNWDDSVLQTIENVDYDLDVKAQYSEAEPTCSENITLEYAFDGFEEQARDEVEFIRYYKAQFHPVVTKDEYLSFSLSGDESHYIVNGIASGNVSSTVIIPDTHLGKPVGEIVGSANFYNVVNLTIPASVTNIQPWALGSKSNLTNVRILGNPNLENYAFYACPNLSSVVIEGKGAYEINNYAFSNCPKADIVLGSGLTSIGNNSFANSGIKELPKFDNLTSIGYRAFQDCKNLENIEFGNKLATLEYAAFTGCSKIKEVVIPDSVTNAIDSVFWNCTSLEKLTIGKGLKTLNYSVVYQTNLQEFAVADGHEFLSVNDGVLFNADGTTLLQYPYAKGGDYVMPNTVTNIENYAFVNTINLNSVTVSSNVTSIPQYCFKDSSVKSVILPEGLNSIMLNAFLNSKIESLSIGPNLTDLDSSAFRGCTSLTSVTIDPLNPNFLCEDLVVYNTTKTRIMFALPCKTGSYTTPDSVTSIAMSAFDHSILDSITIGNNVTSIAQNTFEGASSDITVGNGVTTIPAWCFKDTTSENITISQNVEYIGQNAYENSVIKSFEVPDACVELGYQCFWNSRVETVDFKNVQILGATCFASTPLKKAILPATLTKLKDRSTFNGCSYLEEVDLSNATSLTSVPEYFCGDCVNLVKVRMPNSVTTMGSYAFYNCSKLSDIVLSTGLTALESRTFDSCNSLESLTLPASLTSIGYRAVGSSIMTTIHYAGTSTQWLDDAFKNERHGAWADWNVLASIYCDGDSVELDTSDSANR